MVVSLLMSPGTPLTVGKASRACARRCLLALTLAFAGLSALYASAADTFTWSTNRSRVSADIKAGNLLRVLTQVATSTGWTVYVEPNLSRVVSTKFTDLPPGEALRLLLGDLNFAYAPSTNSRPKLFVFRSSMDRATQLIAPDKAAAGARKPKLIPNELIVRLKPGVKIEDIARLLGAKVTGRIDGLNAYRLQFDDQAAATAASAQLSSNSDVASVENNYAFDRPEAPQAVSGVPPTPLSLTLDPPPANGRTTVGLVDTAVQPLGNGLDAFLLKQLSVAGDAHLDPSSPSHGTAMAEIMLTTLQTLQNGHSSVQILPVDVYGPNESTTSFDIALGIQTAINKGANPINVSSGGPGDSPVLSELVAEAYGKGIMIYASKGNDGGTEMIYPAAYQGVTAVTALDQNGIPTTYANKADIPAIGAKGAAPIPFNDLTWVVQGTSVSAPIVTMTSVALSLQQSLTQKQANGILWQNPTPTTIPNPSAAPHK